MSRLIHEERSRVSITAEPAEMAKYPAVWCPSRPPAVSGMFLGSDTKNQTNTPDEQHWGKGVADGGHLDNSHGRQEHEEAVVKNEGTGHPTYFLGKASVARSSWSL